MKTAFFSSSHRIKMRHLSQLILLTVLTLLFVQKGHAEMLCGDLFEENNVPEIQENILKQIVAGEKTHSYYSAFGSSYGKDPLQQLKGYLDIGARLSPRAWSLLENIKASGHVTLSDQQIARVIVDFLQLETLSSKERQADLSRVLGNEKAAQILLKELEVIHSDIEIFRKNIADVFKIFKDIENYHTQFRDEGWFRSAVREIDTFKNTPIGKKYRKNYLVVFREKWNDSFTPMGTEQFENLKKDLNLLKESREYTKLSKFAREILELRLQREAAGRFYTNYGGLYNNRDRSFVWYAAAESDFSRESFGSIQGYFANKGITFEFKPSTQHRIKWDETIQPDRKLEKTHLPREATTYDVVSLSGNLIPEDVSRVYVSTPELLNQVKQVFATKLGDQGLKQSGITFHLPDEQKSQHRADVNKDIHALGLGSANLPEVKAVRADETTYFLTPTEIDDISKYKRPLKYLVTLKDKKNGEISLETLIKRHAQADQSKTKIQGELLEGGFYADGSNPNKKPTYLNPADQKFTFHANDAIDIEFRPEVSKEQIQALIKNGFTNDFDFRMISRIYFPTQEMALRARESYFQYLGVTSLFRWAQELEVTANQRLNYEADMNEFIENVNKPNNRRLNLDQSDDLILNLPKLNKINLFDSEVQTQVRDFLLSSQNFGIEPDLDMKETLKPDEYVGWVKLQDMVIAKAKIKAPLTIEIVDEFLLTAAKSTCRHAPAGYRELPQIHEIWPGGKTVGSQYMFNLQETAHFFREPYLNLPEKIYRTSNTSLMMDHLSYRKPGNMRNEVQILIDKYHSVLKEKGAVLAAALLYKDLITLHPMTDGNGRGIRSILSYLMLAEGLPAPSFQEYSQADFFLTGQDYLQFIEMGILRGQQNILYPHAH